MKNFTYYQPKTVESAIGMLGDQWGKVELLGGGTDLMDLMKEYVSQPDKVVSLAGIAGTTFDKITKDDAAKTYGIGAMVKLSAIADNEILRRVFPGLTTAAGMVGGPQIRNMGTLGGNLCQRNRCWYFRDEHVNRLLKVAPSASYSARINTTRSSPGPHLRHRQSFDPGAVIAFSAADAGPKAAPFRWPSSSGRPSGRSSRTRSGRQRTVARVTIPSTEVASASYEVRHKQSYDWPLVQAAVAFEHKGGKTSKVRIVLGHVAPIPTIATAAAKAIEGQEINEATAAAAGKAATDGAKALSQNGYKLKLIEVAVKRALLTAAGANRYWEV